MYTLRPYQQEAADRAVSFFNDSKANYNAIEMLATAAGKSLIISEIASRLKGNTLVFCPSKEILQQNYSKYLSYGLHNAGIYSASAGRKEIMPVTFATIQSAINNKELFKNFHHIIVDEAHKVNAKAGEYKKFFDMVPAKVLGLTATPYRLTTQQGIEVCGEFKPNGTYNRIQFFMRGGFRPRPGVKVCSRANLKFLTRTIPRVFSKLIYYVQTSDLVSQGYLTKPSYFQLSPNGWDGNNLVVNSTGADYTDKSVYDEYQRTDMSGFLASVVNRLLAPKDGKKRHGILVFTRFIDEANKLKDVIDGCEVVTGNTPQDERDRIIDRFKNGEIKVLANANVLSTGFDYPDLDTVVMARPTRSLSLYSQIVGRLMRLRSDNKPKEAWFVDLCGNIDMFGKVEDLSLKDINGKGAWAIFDGDRQMTNVLF